MTLRRRNLPVMLLVLAVLLATAWWQERNAGGGSGGGAATGSRSGAADNPAADDADRIARAFQDQESDLWVTAAGRVQRLLPDDNEGSRHQRLIVELASGHTVLVSHNIDLAPRVDGLRTGDAIRFRGEYEWNAQGGVIHWTHHDPQGRHAGGWLEHQGRRYE